MADQNKNRGSSRDDMDRDQGMRGPSRSRSGKSGFGRESDIEGMGDEEQVTGGTSGSSGRTGTGTSGSTAGTSNKGGAGNAGGSTNR